MNLTAERIDAMVTAFDLQFKNAYAAAGGVAEKFCVNVGDSAHSVVELPFFEAFSFMRKWVGPRQAKNLATKKLILKEDAFEDTIGIPQRAIETDNWAIYSTAIAQMSTNAKLIWDQLALEALCNPAAWIDGKAFFGDSRKYGKSPIVNKAAAALTPESFNDAYETMMGYCGHDGNPLGVVPDTLMVGPKNRKTAFEILNAKLISDGTTTVDNPNLGLCEVIVNPRMVGDYANYWFLMSCKGPIKPVALQKSKEPVLTSLNRPTDANVFMEGQALFGTDAYGSAAAAFPHLVYAGIPA